MPKLFSKLLLSFLAAFILLMSFAPAMPTKAADTWYSSGFPAWYSKVYGGDQTEIFGERYTAAQVQWVFYGWMAMVFNWIMTWTGCPAGAVSQIINGNMTGIQCTGTSGMLQNFKQNTASKDQNVLSLIFADRPLSGITYVKDLGRKFHIVPEAHAQTAGVGFGYDALSTVKKLWQASRNFSYAIFVVVILIFAFMIMFRVKISPQVVVTVQSALPKVAIGLVLVTFSYAIAGFLIDLMYVVIGIFSLILAGTGLFNTNVVGIFSLLTTGYANTGIFGFLIAYLFDFLVSIIVVMISIATGFLSQTYSAGVVGAGAVGVIAALPFLIIILMFVLIAIVFILVFMALKIFIALVRAFTTVLLLVVILPLQITIGTVIPGIGFGTWIRTFVGNLLVFPVTGLLFFLSFLFLDIGRSLASSNVKSILNIQNSNSFIIPIAPTNVTSTPGWPPLLGVTSDGTSLIFLVASFIILSMVPKSAEIASSIISGKGFAYGTALGEAVEVGNLALQADRDRRTRASALEKARLEGEIREAEGGGDYTRAQRLREEVARRESGPQFRSEFIKQARKSAGV